MRTWLLPILIAALLVAPLAPWDRAISDSATRLWSHAGGDVKRTVETVQQYGDLATVALVCIVVFLQDPQRRKRVWDLIAASTLTALACWVLKVLIGRPRPGRGLPGAIADGLAGAHPGGSPGDWLLWHGGQWGHRWSSDYWSMPSSHTAAAMALSVFLAIVYPRLWPLAAAMVVVVAVCRVVTVSHYPTDLAVGALVGYLVAMPVVRGRAASRWM